jgi:hypothetical protein
MEHVGSRFNVEFYGVRGDHCLRIWVLFYSFCCFDHWVVAIPRGILGCGLGVGTFCTHRLGHHSPGWGSQMHMRSLQLRHSHPSLIKYSISQQIPRTEGCTRECDPLHHAAPPSFWDGLFNPLLCC